MGLPGLAVAGTPDCRLRYQGELPWGWIPLTSFGSTGLARPEEIYIIGLPKYSSHYRSGSDSGSVARVWQMYALTELEVYWLYPVLEWPNQSVMNLTESRNPGISQGTTTVVTDN
jgi:hypothetical protein